WVRVRAAVVVVGFAVATARRGLVGAAADAEVLGVGHLGAAGAAAIAEVVGSREVEWCSEARLETDGRQGRSCSGRLLRVQSKCARGDETGDCRNAANEGGEAISIDRRVHLFFWLPYAAKFYEG